MVDLVTRFATLVISIVGLLFPIVLRFSTFIVKVKSYYSYMIFYSNGMANIDQKTFFNQQHESKGFVWTYILSKLTVVSLFCLFDNKVSNRH